MAIFQKSSKPANPPTTQTPDSSDPSLDDILAQAKSALQDATSQLKLASAKKQTSPKTNRPFFKEQYALQLKQAIDSVLETGAPVIIPQGDRSENTLRCMVSQAKSYLFDILQPKYPGRIYSDEFKTRLVGRMVPKRGYIISPRRESTALKGLTIKPWRKEFLTFLQSAPPGTVFQRIGIYFSDEDHAFIRKLLYPFKREIVADLSESSVSIHKLTSEVIKQFETLKANKYKTPNT